MRKRTDYILRLKPWSPTAFLAALLAVAFATTMQEVFLSFGAKLYFAYLPAILIASLLAGAPAGTLAALVSIPIVWWAFMPPHFEFNPLTAADYDRFAIFALCSSLVIAFCHLTREALALLRKSNSTDGHAV
jgi:H+/Cl- antiporter ClcA